MDGVGEPTLVVPPGASPHGYAMRPSEAAAVQDADIVFWVGDALNPAFARTVGSLAGDARTVSLLELPDTIRLEFREGATFEAHDHGDGHGHEEAAADDDDHEHEETAAHDDHGHDHRAEKAEAHDDHGHKNEREEAAAHDDHGHDHRAEKAEAHDDHGHENEHEETAAHDEHDHGTAEADDEHGHSDHGHEEVSAHGHEHEHDGVDPHAWLDPMNAKIWVDAIAAALSQADPDNASTYFGNAAAAKDELDTLISEVTETVEPARGQNFVVFHDAYHYFEARFDVEATGAISLGDAGQPSAARISEIKETIGDTNAVCVFSEPQFEPRLVDTVIEGTNASKGVLDPLGADIAPGPDMYPTLIKNLADNLVSCLRPST
ncbi:MAG: zinc ABC transporter substrate-binding protein [Devosia sp.]